MAVTAQRTREEIRVSVGYNVGAVHVGTMTSNGSTTTFVDSTLPNADNSQNGKWFLGTSGTNDGALRPVSTYTGSSTTGTVRGDVLGASTADGDTYELWDADMPPARIHDFLNRATHTVTRKGAPPVTDISLHGYRDRRVFAVPTNVVGIRHVSYRASRTNELIHNCNSIWDELVDGDVTAVADSEDYVEGTASCKFTLAAGLAATDKIATDDLTAVDISKHDTLEFWMKSTVATSAGDLQVILDEGVTRRETLDVPALTADTWTFCRVSLANRELDTAIDTVGLLHTNDIGAAVVWIDDIRAVVDTSAVWVTLHRDHWSVDKDRRELVFNETGQGTVGYSLIKLEGVKKPTELTADTSVCDIDAEYVIARASAWALRARAARGAGSREAAHQEADRLEVLADRWLARQRVPQGVVWVDD